MSRLLAVDPGADTGIAVFLDDQLVEVRTLRKPDGDAAAKWISYTCPSLDVAREKPVLAIEVSAFIRFAGALKALHRQVGGWSWLAVSRGWSIAEVAPRSWQAAFVWPGKQPKHAEMAAAQIAVAERRWPGRKFNEHEAAAALIGQYVIEGLAEDRAETKKLDAEGYR